MHNWKVHTHTHTHQLTHTCITHRAMCWPVSHCCQHWFPFPRVTPVTAAIEWPIFHQYRRVSLFHSGLLSFTLSVFFFVVLFWAPLYTSCPLSPSMSLFNTPVCLLPFWASCPVWTDLAATVPTHSSHSSSQTFKKDMFLSRPSGIECWIFSLSVVLGVLLSEQATSYTIIASNIFSSQRGKPSYYVIRVIVSLISSLILSSVFDFVGFLIRFRRFVCSWPRFENERSRNAVIFLFFPSVVYLYSCTLCIGVFTPFSCDSALLWSTRC